MFNFCYLRLKKNNKAILLFFQSEVLKFFGIIDFESFKLNIFNRIILSNINDGVDNDIWKK